MDVVLSTLLSKYPVLSTILAIIGGFRVIFKPLMTYIEAKVAESPSKEDDKKLEAVEKSGLYKAVAFILDYTASIKLPK